MGTGCARVVNFLRVVNLSRERPVASGPGPSGDRTHENCYGDHQAIQTRRSPRRLDRHWRSRSHGDGSQGIWPAKGSYGNLSRRRIRGELPAQDQDRSRCRLGSGRQNHRSHHGCGKNRTDRRLQDLRHQPRPRGSHPHRRGRCRGTVDFALNHTHSGVKQMTFKRPYSAGLAALAFGLFAATAAYAEPTVNKGDNAWMLTSTVLVLLMTIPGLALFYGGLVRTKNMLSVLMQVFYTVCIVVILWALYGYSLAFTGGSDFIGGFSKAFLMGVTQDSKAATFSVDANISELVYVCFQMTFAAITPALIVGAFAERMKFSAVALFIPLWVTLVYFPIAHMVWYWAGPDAIDAAEGACCRD